MYLDLCIERRKNSRRGCNNGRFCTPGWPKPPKPGRADNPDQSETDRPVTAEDVTAKEPLVKRGIGELVVPSPSLQGAVERTVTVHNDETEPLVVLEELVQRLSNVGKP